MIVELVKPLLLRVPTRFPWLALKRLSSHLVTQYHATCVKEWSAYPESGRMILLSFEGREISLSSDEIIPNEVAIHFGDGIDPAFVSEVRSSLVKIRLWI